MKKISTVIMLMFVLLIGCNSKTEIENGSLIHDEQTQSKEQWSKVVDVAYSKDGFVELWGYFNFDEEHPSVDFKKSSIIIAQTTENSCPKEIKKLEFDNAEENLIIETMQKETTCDDIGNPRTFVFQIDKEKLEKVETIRFEGEEFLIEN